jgi:hypothetical protein
VDLHHTCNTLEGFQQLVPETVTLLGAPLSTGQAMTESLSACCADLSRAVEHLKLVSAHEALLLLKNSLSEPRLLHILRRS